MTNHINESSEEDHNAAYNCINSSYGKRLKCLVCSVWFKNGDIESFKQHMEFHTNDVDIKNLVGDDNSKFKCVLCSKYFVSICKLASHRYYHHNELPYICGKENCMLTFWSSWDLALHQRTFHIKRGFTCKICLKKFNSVQKRMFHIKTEHVDVTDADKSVSCEVCGKYFSMNSHLQMHMAVHTGIKLFKCDMCDKVMKSVGAFISHTARHHKNNQEDSKHEWRFKEQDNINIVLSNVNKQAYEEDSAMENIEQLGITEEEIIGIIDYSQF